ncbi:MAG: hypothetical protein ACK4N5_12200, partial [Myxococcales bacterium]
MRFAAPVLALVCLAAAGCKSPDFIEIEPKDLSFTRRGDKVWARAIAKNRQGHTFPGIKASWKST